MGFSFLYMVNFLSIFFPSCLIFGTVLSKEKIIFYLKIAGLIEPQTIKEVYAYEAIYENKAGEILAKWDVNYTTYVVYISNILAKY